MSQYFNHNLPGASRSGGFRGVVPPGKHWERNSDGSTPTRRRRWRAAGAS